MWAGEQIGHRVSVWGDSAILRQKFKDGELEKYEWIITALNSIKLDAEVEETRKPSRVNAGERRCLKEFARGNLRLSLKTAKPFKIKQPT